MDFGLERKIWRSERGMQACTCARARAFQHSMNRNRGGCPPGSTGARDVASTTECRRVYLVYRADRAEV